MFIGQPGGFIPRLLSAILLSLDGIYSARFNYVIWNVSDLARRFTEMQARYKQRKFAEEEHAGTREVEEEKAAEKWI